MKEHRDKNISPKGARHETPCPCLLTWGLKGCCSDCTIDEHSKSEYAIECGTVNTSKNVIIEFTHKSVYMEHRVSSATTRSGDCMPLKRSCDATSADLLSRTSYRRNLRRDANRWLQREVFDKGKKTENRP